MSTAEKERQALLTVYRSRKWTWKVKYMSDSQVIAIFLRLKKQGKV